MEFSSFNVCSSSGDKLIVYNTLNRTLITIDENLYTVSYLEKLSKIYPRIREFLVQSQEYEKRYAKYYMNSMIYQSTRLNITLMMTMSCNFSCIYCFEGWLDKEIRQVQLDEDKIIAWIIELVKKYRFSQIDLCFHGGEPLLKLDKVLKIGNAIKQFCESNKIFYLFTIVTNGYYLTPEVGVKLKSAGISIFQVTIDGVEDIHDSRRPLKSGQGTFKQIIYNIKNNQSLKCYMNLVYDTKNVLNFYDLIDYIISDNIKDKIDLVVLSSVKPVVSKNSLCDAKLGQIDDANARINMIKYICKRGFRVCCDLNYQLCTMKQKSSVVIMPDLSIYKCISGVGNLDFMTGRIETKDTDPFALQSNIIENNVENSCELCPYMPICNKYCMYESKINNNGKIICNKAYWNEFVPKYLSLLVNDEYNKNILIDPTLEEWRINYI